MIKLKLDFTGNNNISKFTTYIRLNKDDYETYWNKDSTVRENLNLLVHRNKLSIEVAKFCELLGEMGTVTCVKWEDGVENFNYMGTYDYYYGAK